MEQVTARSMASATATPRTEFAFAVTLQGSGRLIGFGRLVVGLMLGPHDLLPTVSSTDVIEALQR